MVLPKSVQPIAREWSEKLFTEMPWQAESNLQMPAGEADGFPVWAPGFGYRGYLKPGKRSDHSDHPRAANEKIVADLAASLGLPVSPVLLHRRLNCSEEQDSCTCVSLIVYAQQWEMSHIKAISGPPRDIVSAAFARSSGMIALDTYIGNMDRNNDRNIIFGIDHDHPDRSAFIFLDHSNSLNMGGRWRNGGWKKVDPPPLYEPFRKSVGATVVMEVVHKIEALPEELIRHIVERIPDDYMPHDHGEIVIEGLIGRRPLIGTVISNVLAA